MRALLLAAALLQSPPAPAPPPGGAVLWRDPGAVESLDFAGGPGGAAGAPRPPFAFVAEDRHGSSTKVRVRDASGVVWSVKFGAEVKPELFASRLAWAAGYFVDPSYRVEGGSIQGVTGLHRALHYVRKDGTFTEAARFERRFAGRALRQEQSWSWDDAPLRGSRELKGLWMVMILTSNWDDKDRRDVRIGSNTAVYADQAGESRYLVTDWGSTLGSWGPKGTRWDCRAYAAQSERFVQSVEGGTVVWAASVAPPEGGRRFHIPVPTDITVSDVAWLMRTLGRVTDAQLRAGLAAAGADPDETACFANAVRSRLDQMKAVAARATAP